VVETVRISDAWIASAAGMLKASVGRTFDRSARKLSLMQRRWPALWNGRLAVQRSSEYGTSWEHCGNSVTGNRLHHRSSVIRS
jgi:hypothetical protein